MSGTMAEVAKARASARTRWRYEENFLERYEIDRTLGKGAYGKVLLVTAKDDPTQRFAMKVRVRSGFVGCGGLRSDCFSRLALCVRLQLLYRVDSSTSDEVDIMIRISKGPRSAFAWCMCVRVCVGVAHEFARALIRCACVAQGALTSRATWIVS